MGKAFSEEERIQVQQKLRKIGLRLFADKGIKGVSIREVTKAAEIAQGGFYTFYKDKTDFLIDLMEVRIKEKLEILKEQAGDSLEDPMQYMADTFFKQGVHLTKNKAFDNMLSGSVELFFNTEFSVQEHLGKYYLEYMSFMIHLWRENGYQVEMSDTMFTAAIRITGVMISNASLIEEDQFEKIYRSFCEGVVSTFLKVEKSNRDAEQ